MTERPLVSVLTPVWNAEAYLEAAVRSVWEQSYRPLEHILVDDGSTDASARVLEELAGEAPIPTTVIRSPHRGIAPALNQALARSRGDFITLLHADDLFLPEKIARQVERLAQDPAALLVHSEYLGIDRGGDRTGYDSGLDLPPAEGAAELRRLLRLEVDVRSMTVMFRREFFAAAGGWDERYPVEDWTSILRAAAMGPVAHVPEALVLRRVHATNLSRLAHRGGRVTPAEFGYPLLRELLPEDMSLGRICALHAGSVVRSAAAQGAWRKAASGFAVVWGLFPLHVWRLAPPALRGALGHLWLRLVRPRLPPGLLRRLLAWKAGRRARSATAGTSRPRG